MSPLITVVPSAPERLHALDAVRALALLLGIVLHATLSFVPASPRFWIIQDTHPSLILGLLSFTIHVFRMTTFFLMAGFFARMSFHRRGPWDFVKDRLQRIGLPLVIAWPLVFAPMALVVIWASGFPNGGLTHPTSSWLPALPNFP
ncbi:acyltransferase family protein [Bradyrhizobium sp. RDM4]|uniref:acyltransferase family protein n=1 Tax=Bradyrhizobium sp. RDM4 TaxID=3378765 RepID=UPI0038FCD5AC